MEMDCSCCSCSSAVCFLSSCVDIVGEITKETRMRLNSKFLCLFWLLSISSVYTLHGGGWRGNTAPHPPPRAWSEKKLPPQPLENVRSKKGTRNAGQFSVCRSPQRISLRGSLNAIRARLHVICFSVFTCLLSLGLKLKVSPDFLSTGGGLFFYYKEVWVSLKERRSVKMTQSFFILYLYYFSLLKQLLMF